MTERLTSPFRHDSTAIEVVTGVDLRGRTAIVTGAYSGIGLETARALLLGGASVTLAVRDRERGLRTAADLAASTGRDRVSVGRLDLAHLTSIRRFASEWLESHDRLDILVNNAGLMACPLRRTGRGWELQFATNHVGHAALTQLLLPALRTAEHARVVQLSSIGHRLSAVEFDDVHFERRDYDKWRAYGQSKTANALFAVGLQQQHGGDGIDSFAVHPGAIMTRLQRHLPDDELAALGWSDATRREGLGFKTPSQGAATSVWAATAPELSGRGGRYLEDCAEAEPAVPGERARGVAAHATDPEAAERLWALTEDTLANA